MQNTFLNILKYIRKQLSKIELKVYAICVFIAAFVWLLMSLGLNYDKRIDIPVVYSNIPEGLIVMNDLPKTISVNVKSSAINLIASSLRKNKKVKIDLGKLEFNENLNGLLEATLYSSDYRYNIISQLNFSEVGREIQPAKIQLKFDVLQEKAVAINVVEQLTYKKGYIKYGEMSLFPKSVKISGPKSIVSGINSLNTKPLVMHEVSDNISTEIGLEIESDDVVYSAESVKVDLKVERYSEFSIFTPIKLNSNIKNIRAKVFPDIVEIKFSMVLPEYKKINESSFIVEAKLDSIDILMQNKLILYLAKKPEAAQDIILGTESVDYIIQQ